MLRLNIKRQIYFTSENCKVLILVLMLHLKKIFAPLKLYSYSCS